MPMPKPKPDERSAFSVGDEAANATATGEFSGQRRLIRPSLTARQEAGRQIATYSHGPALTARAMQNAGVHEDSSHAEIFYFQKQIQAQTRMIVVLENGEQFEGIIEWYDRHAIKLRNLSQPDGDDRRNAGCTRALIYKDSIRYIYKAGENTPQTMS